MKRVHSGDVIAIRLYISSTKPFDRLQWNFV